MARCEVWKYEVADRPPPPVAESEWRWTDQAVSAMLEVAPLGKALKIPYQRPTLYPAVHHGIRAAFERSGLAAGWALRTKAEEGFFFAWLEPRT